MDELWEWMKKEGIAANMTMVFAGSLLGVIGMIIWGHLRWTQGDWVMYYRLSGPTFVLLDVLSIIVLPISATVLFGIVNAAWVTVSTGTIKE